MGRLADERPVLKWDDIQVFLTIARERTLTAAAPKLNLSQPTLGRRLKSLESLVGAPLFVRTSDGLRLTTDGHAILNDAETMERSALALQRRLSNEAIGLVGTLRIASREWILRHILGVSLSAFTRLNPALTLVLVQDTRSLDLNWRDAELAFRFACAERQAFTDPQIIQRRLARVHYDLFASPTYLSEQGGWPVAGQGDGHRLIIGDDARFGDGSDEHWLLRQFPEAKISFNCSCRDTQALACVQGAGIALLPRFIGAGYKLEQSDVGDTIPDGAVWLGYHRDLRTLGRLRELVSHVVKTVQKEC